MSERLISKIKRNVALAPFTTMQVGGAARYFIRISKEEEIPKILEWAHCKDLPILVLGGGSNLVVSDIGFSGLVLKMEIKGIYCTKETSSWVELSASAGESWDSFVEYTVQKGLWGVENMSLIPGTVGAAAVQNISAYGQEVKKTIRKVRAYDTKNNRFVELKNDQCGFGFRKSIFNRDEAGRYIIVSVRFLLDKNGDPNLSRSEIVKEIEKQRQVCGCNASLTTKIRLKLIPAKKWRDNYGLEEIREAVIRLRTSGKLLPPPHTAGNSGTFFRVGVIPANQLCPILRKAYKNIGLPLTLKILACKWKYSSNMGFKLPSRLLIEACGLEKSYYGVISLYKNNCAVLINSGEQSSATDILRLIKKVRSVIYSLTGVRVPVEPVLVGFSDEELKYAFSLERKEHMSPSNV